MDPRLSRRSRKPLNPAEQAGLRRFRAELFEGIQWGEETVLAQTLARVKNLGWTCQLLQPLPDIDRPADLRLLPDTIKATLPVGAA